MGRNSLFTIRALGYVSTVAAFTFASLSSEAIIRAADAVGLFEIDWMKWMIEAAVPILQSPVMIAGAGIFGGAILGRYSLSRWPAKKELNPVQLPAPIAIPRLSAPGPASLSIPAELAGWQVSERDDFDVIAHALIIRCIRNDSGFDVRGAIQYKNRSMAPLFLKVVDIIWSVDGKTPEGKKTGGITVPIPPDRTDSLGLLPIRVYGEKARSGEAAFIFQFGREQGNLRCALAIHYTFDIVKYPENKSVDAVVQENVKLTATYYVAPGD